MSNKTQLGDSIPDLISGRLKQDILEQVADAVQVVAEIETIDSQKAYLKVQIELQKDKRYKLLINSVVRAAAVLFIPLLICSGYLLYLRNNSGQVQQFANQEITTPLGVRSQVILPDGSLVSLNAESTIKFKVPFDPDLREVALTGEAYFEIKKNPGVPFVVKSGNVAVKVLGTKFDFKAFDKESIISVILAEGKVSLNLDGGKTDESLIMKPGDMIVFDKVTNKSVLTNGSIDKYIEWHNGKLVFDETPMPEVVVELGRWFGVEILVDDPQVMNYKLTTTFENESLHQILELIKLSSPIDIKYVNATLNKSNQTQTKSRVIYKKKANH